MLVRESSQDKKQTVHVEYLRSKSTENTRDLLADTGGSLMVTLFSEGTSTGSACRGQGTAGGNGHGTAGAGAADLMAGFGAARTGCGGGVECNNGFGTAPDVATRALPPDCGDGETFCTFFFIGT